MPRALLSVYDKSGLIELARGLTALGWELIASGGTAHMLDGAGLNVKTVGQVTGMPEMLQGRVKTLHPILHGAILARNSEEDFAELAAYGITPIDLVVCNLYPFREAVRRPNISLNEALDQIDIGGVALLRAAAKNFPRVAVVCDPNDYQRVFAALKLGKLDLAARRALAIKAFALTRDYDAAIYRYLLGSTQTEFAVDEHLTLSLELVETLRYGENPHQEGAFYAPSDVGLLGGTLLGGNKQLSYNNLLDLDAAWRAVELFEQPSVVIVKHLNPCGIACAARADIALRLALDSDPVSAFGGVIAVNQLVDTIFVEALGDLFVEAIAAPNFTAEALDLLQRRRKNCRLLRIDPLPPAEIELRSVRGGILAQTVDRGDPADAQWRVVSQRKPTEHEYMALRFAWRACQSVKSNAIVLARTLPEGLATVGIGGGLPSRVDAVKLAVEKAGERAQGAVMASDAFFPFRDGVDIGTQAGVTAIIAPGGSVRDEEIIAAADEANVAMIFTGVRHFRH
ncbi:MAG: bifunctional phosphoribosylaminoimidazolecarboxamide formyltransferase/inosine monophosphate cyclohydrolase [Candidatus Thermofonsia Clade 1 bacterium]|uniref:Bifunctional purine biosynthesis protein PurH n=2 Tax=Candidatus Thermofonsia Clade 1 bacterium TaxID=2364210 RepID=A0A2M8PZG5_9CHLR|nr:MAG: bifunctional phosphoribosylaminoimidazolecarboxamide formyltransferase/inosine monophosphate cyclohydrolase [Candidatus Thermofonsia Clade 1 bacterium]